MICQLDENGYCERHKTHHVGEEKRYALEDSHLGEKYRWLWDNRLRAGQGLEPLPRPEPPVAALPPPARPPVPAGPPPSTRQKILNFSLALVKHVADLGRVRSADEVQQIYETHCTGCEFLVNGHCTHVKCGCAVAREEKFFNKLSWRSEHCPVGKW